MFVRHRLTQPCLVWGMIDPEFAAYLEGLSSGDRITVERALAGLNGALARPPAQDICESNVLDLTEVMHRRTLVA
jgi:hypothetical protein